MDNDADRRSAWTFLTNHARVLLAIAADPQARMRDMAAKIGITERAAQGIVADLVEAGYLERIRVGRRNHYQIRPDQHFRHPAEADMPVQVLIDMFTHRDLPSGALRTASEPVLRHVAEPAQPVVPAAAVPDLEHDQPTALQVSLAGERRGQADGSTLGHISPLADSGV